MKTYLRFSLTLLVLVFCFPVQAEQKKIFSGQNGAEYEVHYNAFNSTFLQPNIAKQYGLVRSKALGVVNVSVLRRNADGSTTAVGTVVEGRVINDIQQQQTMGFQQVIEGDAIYYLAQMQFIEGEILTFDLKLYPQGETQALRHRFTHAFYN